jgi:hypothetical protein
MEFLKRQKANKKEWNTFPKQEEVIKHPAKLKAIQSTRRAGKSYTCGIYLMKTAFENPNVAVLYISLTRDSCMRIMFNEVFREIDTKMNLGGNFNKHELSITLPNGSRIYMIGVDASPEDSKKILGQKYQLVVIDEAAFFRQSLKTLVTEILMPAIADYNGTIIMISTTSHLLNTYYYNVVNGIEKGWQVFKFDYRDNPYMREKIERQMSMLRENNPNVDKTPEFRRMYLNEWVIADDLKVYKPTTDTFIDAIPDGKGWTHIMGIDLGYNDATAFSVACYNKHDHRLYIVETYQERGMIIEDVADSIRQLRLKYPITTMVIDGASKQVVEELKHRYSLHFEIAEKQDKRGYIEMLNSDLITGKVKVLKICVDLKKEWDELTWDERAVERGKYIENAKYNNHISDSVLYVWRWAYNYVWSKEETETHEDRVLKWLEESVRDIEER